MWCHRWRVNTKSTSPRFMQLKTRGWDWYCGSLCHSAPEIPYNHHISGQITDSTSCTACNSRDTSHTSTVRPIKEPHNPYDLVNRRALQPEHMIDSNFSHDNHYEHVHNPSITLSCQETVPFYLRPIGNESSLLASVMLEQPIIQAVISSVEVFNGTNHNFETLIVSLENAVQISGQDILQNSLLKDGRIMTYISL